MTNEIMWYMIYAFYILSIINLIDLIINIIFKKNIQEIIVHKLFHIEEKIPYKPTKRKEFVIDEDVKEIFKLIKERKQ